MKTTFIASAVLVAALARAGEQTPPDPLLEIHRHIVGALQSVHDTFPEPLKKFTETFPPTALPRAGMIRLAQADPGAPARDGGPFTATPYQAGIAGWANDVATY